jgi:hypothetical protein
VRQHYGSGCDFFFPSIPSQNAWVNQIYRHPLNFIKPDRIESIIISGGKNVSAKEVETVFNQRDGICLAKKRCGRF